MSVLIMWLKMQKEETLKIAIRDGTASVYLDEGKADYYSVIELPDHGDLIDRDEQIERAWRLKLDTRELIAEMLNTATVVIPAERNE